MERQCARHKPAVVQRKYAETDKEKTARRKMEARAGRMRQTKREVSVASRLMLAKEFPIRQQCGRWENKAPAVRRFQMDRIMRIPEVVELTGLSKTTIWRQVRSGDFPAPVRLGSLATRSIGWREGDVGRWLDSRPALDN